MSSFSLQYRLQKPFYLPAERLAFCSFAPVFPLDPFLSGPLIHQADVVISYKCVAAEVFQWKTGKTKEIPFVAGVDSAHCFCLSLSDYLIFNKMGIYEDVPR